MHVIHGEPRRDVDISNTWLMISLWRQLPGKRKFQLLFLLALSLLSAAAEAFSLAALVPFLSVFIDPSQIYRLSLVKPFLEGAEMSQRRARRY